MDGDSKTVRTGVLRHVVLFRFRTGATEAGIRHIEEQFRQLPGQIAEVLEFEWGVDINEESRSQGFTHCFVLTFDSTAARDAYQRHPAHQAFVGILKPDVEQLLVLDYWAQI